ncbi:MAG TPA: crosslink repair DNA glycosylase YcaQ family protein [Solirubrobacteraceae bacterium]|nr:crosslink repair DNA glycosylase YcaQ family protein [Solirubrobacteraceae bacterium]
MRQPVPVARGPHARHRRRRARSSPEGSGARSGTLLVDGLFTATWSITRRHDTAVLEIAPFRGLGDQDAVVAEADRLLDFVAADAADHDVRFVSPPD